jgi:hypothetical protein
MGIAIFTNAKTGEDVYIDTSGAAVGSVGLGDKGTTIIRQAPKQDGGFDTETVTVQEDFWHVIDALAVARLRE